MKLISWNVNGIRACIKKGFYDFVKNEDPDILCIQETKMQERLEDVSIEGYLEFWNSADKPGYSGTLIYTKKEPLSVEYGIDSKYNDEGRLITLEYDDFYIVTSYSPNAREGLVRIDYREEFEDDFRNYLSNLKEKKPVIVCGDLNVAHNPIDLKNPNSNEGNPGYSIQERTKFNLLLESGYIDTFRYLYPDTVKYSWWSYRFFARQKGIGWRIDYFLVSNNFIDRVVDSLILDDVLGSDHCPVELIIK